MKSVTTTKAPAAIGPYSQAMIVDRWVFVSGQLGIEPVSGQLRASFGEQVRQALANLEAILFEAGARLSNVVKCTVYLTDLDRFAEFNAIYESVFEKPWPAREVVQVVRLPRGAEVEISAVAFLSP
jgi:2-iminobutanoate/2-iminopropanoate deaminase